MSETTKKTAKTKAAAAAEAAEAVKEEAKAAEPVMYAGPTIHGVATQNVVYVELPEGLKAAIKAVPVIANLCIPVSKYAEAEKQIREKKGYIWSAYKRALEFKEGGH